MSGPRFAPRDYAEDAAGFGRVPTLRWKTVSESRERVFLRAAQLQHQQVLRIRARMAAHDVGVKQYAAAAGTSYPRLLRVMRGEAILRLEDIALADLVLGGVIEERVPVSSDPPVATGLSPDFVESLPERVAQAVLDRIAARQRAAGQQRPVDGAPRPAATRPR